MICCLEFRGGGGGGGGVRGCRIKGRSKRVQCVLN